MWRKECLCVSWREQTEDNAEVTLCACIREVNGRNPNWNTEHPDILHGIAHSLQANAGIKLRLRQARFSPLHCSPIILPFDAIPSDITDSVLKWTAKKKTALTATEGRAVAQAISRWLPTAAASVRVRAACGVCGGQSGTGAGFLRVLRFPLPIIPPISPSS
jgi:hypothetical protein